MIIMGLLPASQHLHLLVSLPCLGDGIEVRLNVQRVSYNYQIQVLRLFKNLIKNLNLISATGTFVCITNTSYQIVYNPEYC